MPSPAVPGHRPVVEDLDAGAGPAPRSGAPASPRAARSGVRWSAPPGRSGRRSRRGTGGTDRRRRRRPRATPAAPPRAPVRPAPPSSPMPGCGASPAASSSSLSAPRNRRSSVIASRPVASTASSASSASSGDAPHDLPRGTGLDDHHADRMRDDVVELARDWRRSSAAAARGCAPRGPGALAPVASRALSRLEPPCAHDVADEPRRDERRRTAARSPRPDPRPATQKPSADQRRRPRSRAQADRDPVRRRVRRP